MHWVWKLKRARVCVIHAVWPVAQGLLSLLSHSRVVGLGRLDLEASTQHIPYRTAKICSTGLAICVDILFTLFAKLQ